MTWGQIIVVVTGSDMLFASGLGQHFQDLSQKFLLYGPTLSWQITF